MFPWCVAGPVRQRNGARMVPKPNSWVDEPRLDQVAVTTCANSLIQPQWARQLQERRTSFLTIFCILEHRTCCNATKIPVQLRTVVLFCTHLLSPPPSEKVDLPPPARLGAFFCLKNVSGIKMKSFELKDFYETFLACIWIHLFGVL